MSHPGNNPFFSIIIPTYNYAHYLPRTLDSVIAQNGDDYEVVVIDDGSIDHTGEVIRNYGKLGDRLTYASQPNSGPSAARNHGVKRSRGLYLLFLDADDCLLPHALDHFRAAIKQARSPDFVFGSHERVDGNSSVRLYLAQPLSSNLDQNFSRYCRRFFTGLTIGSAVVHRRVFDCIQFPESIRTGEDIVFGGQVLALYEGVSFPEPVLRKYSHPDSAGHNLARVRQDSLKMVDLLFDPKVLPSRLMRFRREFFSRRCLRLFRLCCQLGCYDEARSAYAVAIRTYPAHLCRLDYAIKYLQIVFNLV